MAARDVNLEKIRAAVDRCCKTEAECNKCEKVGCLIGYCQLALDYSRQKHSFRIPGGTRHIPRRDFKAYYQSDLLLALAEVLLQCQGCRDNHEEECVINVTRSALELALLGETIDYEGSALLYLMQVNRINPDIGKELMQFYEKNKPGRIPEA
ncbi:MAG TPA: hypothetical protein GXX19_08690 [Syntrophomonadaceae bacterium]|nr:hypothetical protein [Syntrophomonadaceae bacterium]